MHTYIYTYMMYICVYIYVYVYMYMYLTIYKYRNTYLFFYIYIYIEIEIESTFLVQFLCTFCTFCIKYAVVCTLLAQKLKVTLVHTFLALLLLNVHKKCTF